MIRVTDTQFNAIMQNALQSNKSELNTLFEQAATSKKLNHLSDDPIGSVKLQGLSQTIEENTQYSNNSDNVISNYQLYETFVSTAVDITQSINDLILRGKNGDLDEESRAGIVIELESYRDELVDIFNHQEQGSYFFSGTDIETQAINPATYTITGNNDHRLTVIGEGRSIENNMTVIDTLGTTDIFTAIDNVIAEFSNATAAFQTVTDDALNTNNQTMSNLSKALSVIGGRINTLERYQDTSQDLILFSQVMSDEIAVADYADVSLKLNQGMIALEATQKAYLEINQYSLFKLM